MEPSLILPVSLAVVFLAGATQGLTGFGFSLVTVPILVVFYETKVLIPAIIILSLAINLQLFYRTRKHAEPKRIWPLMLGGAIGIPFGTLLLLIIDHQSLKLFIGLLIIVFGLAYLYNFRIRVKKEKLALFPIGLTSGVLNGSISMSGPPVIFFFTNQGIKKRIFRANLITYFVFLNLITLPFFFAGGLFDMESLGLAVIHLPAIIMGVMVGGTLVRKVDDGRFRKIVLFLVTCAGALSLASGLGWL